MYEYLFGSLVFLVVWVIFYFIRKDLRRCLIFSSFLCLPLGALEVLFIPHYWNPQRLFGLNPAIESFLLMFSIGGIVSVLYEIAFSKKLEKINEPVNLREKKNRLIGLLILVSIILSGFIFNNNYIYIFSISMLVGAFSIAITRKVLLKKIILSGSLFSIVYFLSLVFLNTVISHDWISRAWNFFHISGLFVFEIPIEEILWAFSFGLFWSTLYQIMGRFQ